MYKQIQIMWLRETANCVVEEYNDGILECTKNRYGNRTMEHCKGCLLYTSPSPRD